jgi:hypothetical protein
MCLLCVFSSELYEMRVGDFVIAFNFQFQIMLNYEQKTNMWHHGKQKLFWTLGRSLVSKTLTVSQHFIAGIKGNFTL